MSDSKTKQIKNSAVYIFATIIGNIIPIFTLPIFTRILSKEDYGAWALAQIYAVFFSGLANFGLIIGCERNFFQYKELRKIAALLYSTLSFVIITSAVFAGFTYFTKAQFAKWIVGSPEHADLLFWSYCTTAIVGLKAYYLMYFKNTEDAGSFVFYTIDELFLGVVFSLFFVAYLRIGIIGLVWGQLLASLLVFLLITRRFLKLHSYVFSWEILKDSLKLSYPLTPRIFFGVIGTQFDKYMIGLLASIGGVGVFNIGQRLANIIFTYMTSIQNVYSPQVYKRMFEMGDGGAKSVGTYLTPFLYASIAIALLVALFCEEAIHILTPKSYHDAIEIVIVLSMYYGSMFFGKQPQLLFAKKTYITSALTLVTIGLNVALNIPFIIKWGAIGAAWATCLAGLISGIIYFVVSQRYYHIAWEYKRVVAIMGTFFGSALLLVIFMHLSLPYTVKLIFKCSVLVLYWYIGVRLHVLTMEHLRIVKTMISPAALKMKLRKIKVETNGGNIS